MSTPNMQKPVAGKATGRNANQKTEPNNNSPSKWLNQAKWRERNPKKVWAHAATRSALRRGLIVKQPCVVCGSEDSEAHHHDYDRVLDITWTCRTHHKALHAALRKVGET